MIKLQSFEKGKIFEETRINSSLTEDEINEKYEKGEARIVTEQGAIKLPLIKDVFSGGKYEKMPIYQRRITWDDEKRSRLIESFIMNVPIPPIFIYEIEYGKYEVMDGLQRVSSIQDFYEDRYELVGLTEWEELNGMKYSQLPQKIREGIDRRQITVISLLKESAKSPEQEQKMKRMVFERLNTGGVKLEEQEVRNALYSGPFNALCVELSKVAEFRKMWGIPEIDGPVSNELSDQNDIKKDANEIEKNKMYMRMYDVELVLRFFAMRHLDEFSKLSDFLDAYLIFGNKKIEDDVKNRERYRELFMTEIKKAYDLFGDKAFCIYVKGKEDFKWTTPKNMVYDPLMLALSSFDISSEAIDKRKNVELLESEYKSIDDTFFDGKRQSKNDIKKRIEFFEGVLLKLDGVTRHE